MKWLEVEQSSPLRGSLHIPGAKNSLLGLMAAACLANEPVFLDNIPGISDVDTVSDILKGLGAAVTRRGSTCSIDPRGIQATYISPQHSAAIRTAYYFVGSLLAKHKKVTVGYPGGDNFVSRPIDQHFKGLQVLGARVTLFDDCYTVEADCLTGAEVYFDVITSGATLNLMMAAVLAKGKTVLHNAACDPEVVDAAVLLNKMGAKIYGAGTNTIRIQGVEDLHGCTHSVIPDRLVAGTFLMAAGITGGEITVHDVVPDHLAACIHKLEEMGMEFQVGEDMVTAVGGNKIRASRVRAEKYPMFETDFQAMATALLLKAEGRSVIADRIFPQRFSHCEQLKRMGADITHRRGVARINRYQPLKGTWVHANDIRAGVCLILAGLMAEGITCITGVEHIERGYADVVKDFTSLGAKIRVCYEAADRKEWQEVVSRNI